MTRLRQELESAAEQRVVGSGWISGALSLTFGVLGLGTVLCLMFPDYLTVPDARKIYDVPLIRAILQLVLIAGFVLGTVSIVLRRQKVLGLTALSLILSASLLGGSQAQRAEATGSAVYLGLDWFILNLIFTGVLFIPLERLLKKRDQPIFRMDWREDLFYFLVSSLFVQSLSFLSLAPSLAILHNTDWGNLRNWVGSQPIWLQFLEIMFLTDLVQYWVHRAFHRIPWLWKFHAVHHSAEVLDWLAGSRMHFLEIVCLRGCTLVPMYILGFTAPAMYAYIFFVYLFSTVVHSNLGIDFGVVQHWFVTPRYHHWHHGIEKEAIDVNFAVHFPLFDRLFGTYFLPADGRWPAGYGVHSEPVPKGYLKQFLYPFTRSK
jgi:sterol desaturase/sphingolipid hydroxylase (fatty acid hydroxylase superfamily)